MISLGTPDRHNLPVELAASPIVVSYAPHQQLISRSDLVVTHAGMNTTLSALSNGKPMVAIPITNEQPGIAARIARTGAGEVVPLSELSDLKLRSTIRRVLGDESYKRNAARMQTVIAGAGGVRRAADVIEQAITTGQPVLAKIN